MNNLKYLLDTVNVFGYNSGNYVEKLKDKIGEMYTNDDVFITLNGRTAIFLFLESLGLQKGDKVALQAFTCNAVINPILALGLEPLYVDIDRNTFNMSFESLQKSNLEGVKVLISQHTFGIPADTRIYEFCKQRGIVVLEDCAHTLGDKEIGGMGDAMMLSFGLEKLMPTRVGGALVVNNKSLVANISQLYKGGKAISFVETFKWMINPLLWRVIRIFPEVLSRLVIDVLKVLGLLKSGFSKNENNGNQDYLSFKVISDILAKQVIECLSELKENIDYRRSIAFIYKEGLDQKYPKSIIRYPYISKNPQKLIQYLESEGYPSSERWFAPVIFPSKTNLEAMKYAKGSCPVAEEVGSKIVNLPTGTNVSKEKALEIVKNVIAIG